MTYANRPLLRIFMKEVTSGHKIESEAGHSVDLGQRHYTAVVLTRGTAVVSLPGVIIAVLRQYGRKIENEV